MTAALAVLLALTAATLPFSGEPLDGFSVSPVNPASGTAQPAWLTCDLNADGAQDWLTPEGVYLQHNGRFPRSHFVPFEGVAKTAWLDVWDTTVYAWDAQGLSRLRLAKNGWELATREQLDNPALAMGRLPERARKLSRFLFDLDGDGTPELVAITEHGLHLFTKSAGRHLPAGLLDVLPPMALVPVGDVSLWPKEARHIQIPHRYRYARLWLEQQTATIMTWENAGPGQRRFLIANWPITKNHGNADAHFSLPNAAPTPLQTLPLPDSAVPCQLNPDGTVDFYGVDTQMVTGGAMPQPVLETWVTLDAGTSILRKRSAATFRFRQHTHFVDFDADGRLDWLVESPDLFGHGPRETLARFATRRHVGHTLEVYLQNTDATFGQKPAFSHKIRLEFTAPPIKATPDYEAWLAGRRLDLTGDFNGDGQKDLVVRERMDRLSVYLSTPSGFPAKAAAVIALDAAHDFAVYDVNGDGLSDIVVSPPQHAEQTAPPIIHYNGGAR